MVHFFEALLYLYASPAPAAHTSGEPSRGQGLVEYALILAFITIVLFLGVVFFGARINGVYSKLASSIPSS
jgi:Flp pilus assembly pilin Flp